MSELDDKQSEILSAWGRGECVQGYAKGEFGIQHAMMNAVTGPHSKEIAGIIFKNEFDNAGYELAAAVRLVARELAASHLGYPYLDDAEKAMKEKEG